MKRPAKSPGVPVPNYERQRADREREARERLEARLRELGQEP